jgi:hypothetical protein
MNRKRTIIPPPNCPGCGQPLDRVCISTYTTQIWKGDGNIGRYEEDPKSGDAEERCPYCERKYPCENKKTGAASCVDVEIRRRVDADNVTPADYGYCENCETFFDLWKYGDLESAGHAGHRVRQPTPEEFRNLVKSCKQHGCFKEQ